MTGWPKQFDFGQAKLRVVYVSYLAGGQCSGDVWVMPTERLYRSVVAEIENSLPGSFQCLVVYLLSAIYKQEQTNTTFHSLNVANLRMPFSNNGDMRYIPIRVFYWRRSHILCIYIYVRWCDNCIIHVSRAR